MSQKPIALEPLDAEAEADRLLEEDDLAQQQAAAASAKGAAGVEGPRPSEDGFEQELGELEGEELGLPRPVAAIKPVAPKMHPAPLIIIWICLSSSVILMNAWVLGDDPGDLGFSYPIFLTTFHLVFATIATRLMYRFTSMLDGVNEITMSWSQWRSSIVPIGALFSGSLIFNNIAYLSLTVPFIQMLKAFTSVAVLTMSVLAGLDKFNQRTATTVVAISCGVMIASYGELNFVLGGFIAQVIGITFEATRLVAIQKLLQGTRMDPLVSLYYYAPVCAVFNSFLIPIFEGWAPFTEVLDKVGPVTLFVNASVALCLNISVVFLIGCSSSLVLTLSGVIKDILLVAGSVVLFGDAVSGTQLFGYSIALGGLVVFKTSSEQLAVWVAQLKQAIGR